MTILQQKYLLQMIDVFFLSWRDASLKLVLENDIFYEFWKIIKHNISSLQKIIFTLLSAFDHFRAFIKLILLEKFLNLIFLVGFDRQTGRKILWLFYPELMTYVILLELFSCLEEVTFSRNLKYNLVHVIKVSKKIKNIKPIFLRTSNSMTHYLLLIVFFLLSINLK